MIDERNTQYNISTTYITEEQLQMILAELVRQNNLLTLYSVAAVELHPVVTQCPPGTQEPEIWE